MANFSTGTSARGGRIAPLATVLGAALLGGLCSLWAMNHDIAIFFQAGLRILSGQIPYKDFHIPQGPVTGMVAALFLAVTPTVGYGVVLASAVLNAAAAYAVLEIVRIATGNRRYGLLAGALTAVWFVPVMGAFYTDHLAYCLVLVSYLVYCRSSTVASFAVSGCLMALAYHSKQPIGLIGMFSLVVARLAGFGGRSLKSRSSLAWLVAYFAGHGAVLGLLGLFSSLRNYFFYAFQIPVDFAFVQGNKSLLGPLTVLFLPWGVDPLRTFEEFGFSRMAFYPLVMAVYVSYFIVWRTVRKARAEGLESQGQVSSLIFLTLSTVLCGGILGRYHGHLFFGMGGTIVLCLSLRSWAGLPVSSRWEVGIVSLFALLGGVQIWAGGVGRAMAEPHVASFLETDLRPLRIEVTSVTSSNEEVVRFLKEKPGRITLLNGAGFLIPLALRRAPLNPALYYEGALTVPSDPVGWRRWEDDLLRSTSQGNPDYVVAGHAWERYRQPFERTVDHLTVHYREVFSGGRFVVLQRRGREEKVDVAVRGDGE